MSSLQWSQLQGLYYTAAWNHWVGDTGFSRAITAVTWGDVFMCTPTTWHTHNCRDRKVNLHIHTGVLATASFTIAGLYPEVHAADWRHQQVCVCVCVKYISVKEEGNNHWWGHELVNEKKEASWCFSITSHSNGVCCAFVVDTNQTVCNKLFNW